MSIRGALSACQRSLAEQVNGWKWARWRPDYPCLLCAGRGGAAGLCADCRCELPWNRHPCRHCALPLAQSQAAAGICRRCARREPVFARAVCPFRYAFPVDRLLLALKFDSQWACGRLLGALLAETVRALPGARPELLIPVPLHRRRFLERGFNQADELARPVRRALAIPLARDVLTRVQATRAQSGLPGRERERNVRAAFRARAGTPPRHVALIDDVLTTGHTASAAARALRDAGAIRVEVWCVARATGTRV